MIRSKYHTKTPMNHKIRIRITRDRWTPEDIEAGDSHDLGECWDELFEDEEEADAYLWRHMGVLFDEFKVRGPLWWAEYTDDGDTRETIENGGTIRWTAKLVD